MNPYEPPSGDPTQTDSSCTDDNPPNGRRTGLMILTLALMGGTAALIGLVLGIYSVGLIASSVGLQGRVGYLAILAVPIAAVTLSFSLILLTFGLLAVRDAYRQHFERRICTGQEGRKDAVDLPYNGRTKDCSDLFDPTS